MYRVQLKSSEIDPGALGDLLGEVHQDSVDGGADLGLGEDGQVGQRQLVEALADPAVFMPRRVDAVADELLPLRQPRSGR